MSMISRAPAAAPSASWTALLQAKFKVWWAAYKTRRIELAAIQRLEGMSDRDLRDIGLTRGEIVHAVSHDSASDISLRRTR